MDLLEVIGSGSPIDGEVVVVLAHPDDESASAAALLQRSRWAKLIYLTDGAPRDLEDARREGCGDWRAYAELRKRELRAALSALDAAADPTFYDLPDKQAHEHLDWIVEQLFRELDGADAVISHAYEHGHPDHDTAAFAVALARRRLAAEAPAAFEFAGYHLAADGPVYGRFHGETGTELHLTPVELERKAAGIDAYRSQRDTLALFPLEPEYVRPARSYDFARSAPPGRALYDLYGWDITSERWRSAVAEPVQ